MKDEKKRVINLRDKTELVATNAHPFQKEGSAIKVHPEQKEGLITKGWAVEKGASTAVTGAAVLTKDGKVAKAVTSEKIPDEVVEEVSAKATKKA